MRFFYLVFSLFSVVVWANPQAITPLVNYNFDQDSSLGYGLSYRYTLLESIELESTYLKTQELKYTDSKTDFFGKYDALYLGGNISRLFNPDLSFKFGAGMAYTFNSDNEALVADKKWDPYFKFTFNYKLSPHTNLEFGQLNHFHNEGALDISHSAFIGISWVFGSEKSAYTRHKASKQALETSTRADNTTKLLQKTTSATTESPTEVQQQGHWFIQFGAYSQLSNAEQALNTYQKSQPHLVLSIKHSNKLYRLLSIGYADKPTALQAQQSLGPEFSLSSYIIYLP